MNPYLFPLALLAFLAFVAVVPAWMWFLNDFSHAEYLTSEERFIAALVLPATVAVFLASWIRS